jgi:hypothetical protein
MAKTDWQMGDTVLPDDLNQIGQEINQNRDNLAAHTAATTGVHGATSAATPNRLVIRDSAGRAKFAAPAASDDAARKAEVDAVSNAAMKKTADSDLNMNGFSVTNINNINLRSPTTLTISGDAITVTRSFHLIDTEGGASTDDLSTINGGTNGDLLFLRLVSNLRTVTIRHNVGNIYTLDGSDVVLNSISGVALFIRYSANWIYVGIPGVKRSGDTMTGNLGFPTLRGLEYKNGDTDTTADLVSFPELSSGQAVVRIFRNTNTTGTKILQINKGDGTTAVAFQVTNGEITFLNGRTVTITAYAGNPNGNVAAPPGSICLNTSGGASTTIWVKESGTGNTGWVAK